MLRVGSIAGPELPPKISKAKSTECIADGARSNPQESNEGTFEPFYEAIFEQAAAAKKKASMQRRTYLEPRLASSPTHGIYEEPSASQRRDPNEGDPSVHEPGMITLFR